MNKMKDFSSEIKNSVEALLKLENEGTAKQNLFGKEKNVCLRISLFCTPKVYRMKRKYLKLRHSRFGNDPEVCLFVPNRKDKFDYKVSVDDSIELTIDYYTNFLSKHKVQGIKTIMPLKQLQSEYSPFELRRKLVNRFDLFLCKTSLLYNPRFISSLGKFFIKSNKDPLGISFPSSGAPYDPKFNEDIEKAIYSTTFRIKPFSDNYGVPIGTLSHTKAQLTDNLKIVLKQILEEDIIPGGFSNIKAMYLGTSSVGAVPLYICEDLPENLKAPRIKSKRKGVKTVEGEISTRPGKRVIVKRSGDVIVEPLKRNKMPKLDEIEETDDDGDFEDGSEVDEEERKPAFKVNDNEDANGESENKGDDSESDEDDEEIEKRESRLLVGY